MSLHSQTYSSMHSLEYGEIFELMYEAKMVFIDCDDSLVCRLVDQGHWQSLASYKGMQTLHQVKWYHLYSSLQLVQV
jgi:hypothetical protein